MPMTTQDWLNFYSDWSYNQLLQEVEVCHEFQQNTLGKVAQKLLDHSTGLNLLVQSQRRENIIHEVIRDKVKEGNLE